MLHCSKFAKMIALKLLLNNARAGDNPRREMSLPVSCLIRAAVTEMDSAMLLWAAMWQTQYLAKNGSSIIIHPHNLTGETDGYYFLKFTKNLIH